ncbi:MAG TPA: hypothetical protein ENH22_00990 [Candidatus Campbellbacteria bacterium]|nr:hypothetical protein [Candidatus Campbellbacteria bacterium]
MSLKKPILKKAIKLLWGRSHNRCAICQTELVAERKDGLSFPVGVMAHIEGENPDSARYNPDLDYPEKNCYENLILLCPTCHIKIDNDPQTFTVEKLKQIKNEHENWCDQAIRNLIPDITYAELEIILKHIMAEELPEFDEKLLPLHPAEKIKKNRLSSKVDRYIRIGSGQFPLVKNFINDFPDIHFSDRLKNHFVQKYRELKPNLNGDELFYTLWDFACGNTNDFKYRTAGLVVLTYFFQQCDVFEL